MNRHFDKPESGFNLPKELSDMHREQKQDIREKRNDRLSIIAILIALASLIVAIFK